MIWWRPGRCPPVRHRERSSGSTSDGPVACMLLSTCGGLSQDRPLFAFGLMASAPQYGGAWPRIRKKILERDGYVCQVRGPRCRGHATQVDHIVPVTQGGAWWDESNLRASCQPCNRDRVDSRGTDRWKRATTRIVLVVGPPCAGKAQHVQEAKQPSDLVIDYDAIADALGARDDPDGTVHRSAMAARNALLGALRRGECDARRAWIISANPKAESVFPFHERVVVDPGHAVVVERARAERRDDAVRLINEWYEQRSGVVPGATDSSRDWFA